MPCLVAVQADPKVTFPPQTSVGRAPWRRGPPRTGQIACLVSPITTLLTYGTLFISCRANHTTKRGEQEAARPPPASVFNLVGSACRTNLRVSSAYDATTDVCVPSSIQARIDTCRSDSRCLVPVSVGQCVERGKDDSRCLVPVSVLLYQREPLSGILPFLYAVRVRLAHRKANSSSMAVMRAG